MKREFCIMVGPSGSGKSTKAQSLANNIRLTFPKYDSLGRADIVDVISSDDIREELLGDVFDQSQNDKVFAEIHNRIRMGLTAKHHIIVDACSINIKDRRPLLECFRCLPLMGKDIYIKVAYVMSTPANICKAQNRQRDSVVPDYVIDRQISHFEIPFYEEGFNEIIIEGWKLNNITQSNLEPITYLMKGFNQRTHHHAYTLDVHCQKVAEEVIKRSDNESLIRAAYIHDIGKVFTAEPKEDGSGEYRYYSHHNVGAYYLLQNIDLIAFPDKDKTLDVLFYVNHHMLPFFITDHNGSKSKQKAYRKWQNIFGEKKFNDLLLFNQCDILGSGRGEKDERNGRDE